METFISVERVGALDSSAAVSCAGHICKCLQAAYSANDRDYDFLELPGGTGSLSMAMGARKFRVAPCRTDADIINDSAFEEVVEGVARVRESGLVWLWADLLYTKRGCESTRTQRQIHGTTARDMQAINGLPNVQH